MDSPRGIKDAWRQALKDRGFFWEAVLTLAFLASTLTVYPNLLNGVEKRQGVRLADPVLELFEPVDATVVTFVVLYVSLAVAVWFLLSEPKQLMIAFQAYVVLSAFRFAAILLVPLDPPDSIIALKDPFTEYFGANEALTKDLFFSGHTSLAYLYFLTARMRWLRKVFLACTVLIGCCVLIQHVHYTIDVLVAPFVTYGSLAMVRHLQRRLGVTDRAASPSDS